MTEHDDYNPVATIVNDDMLNQVDDFNSAMNLVAAYSLTAINVNDTIANHFPVIDKEELLNRPFMVLRAREVKNSEQGTRYWTLWVITKDNERGMFSDGSTGIARQLDAVAAENYGTLEGKPFMTGGLRVSRYTYTDDSGKKSDAKTFYLKPYQN